MKLPKPPVKEFTIVADGQTQSLGEIIKKLSDNKIDPYNCYINWYTRYYNNCYCGCISKEYLTNQFSLNPKIKNCGCSCHNFLVIASKDPKIVEEESKAYQEAKLKYDADLKQKEIKKLEKQVQKLKAKIDEKTD